LKNNSAIVISFHFRSVLFLQLKHKQQHNVQLVRLYLKYSTGIFGVPAVKIR